jgi:hypothetical protein
MPSLSAEEQRARRARAEAVREMERVARAGQLLTYEELVAAIKVQRYAYNGSQLTRLLCDISRATFTEKEVLLSAVVVLKKERIPGEGFFLFARHDLGLEIDDEIEFWEQQREAVYTADWS